MSRSRSWGERFGTKLESILRDYGSELVSLLAIAGTAIASISGVWGGPFLWIGLGAAIGVSAIWLRKRARDSFESIMRARDEALVDARSSRNALHDAIGPLARNLNVYLDLSASHQRLSVYLHRDNSFILVSRVAHNPLFRAPGRDSYPENQGVIGTIWTKGDAMERIGRSETWEDWCIRFGFSAHETTQLRMKSKCIAAVRLDIQDESVGILLIESENPRGISNEAFERLQASYIRHSLAELLLIVRPHIKVTPRS